MRCDQTLVRHALGVAKPLDHQFEPGDPLITSATFRSADGRPIATWTAGDGPVRLPPDTGLAVTWLHYRGTGHVTFDPMSSAIKSEGATPSGTATTLVKFSQPGTYVLRVFADDGVLTSGTNVTVIVKGAPAAAGQ